MKPSQFSQLSGYLESEYITSANNRRAIMLNIGAILIIIGILGGAIWKIKTARKRKLNSQDKRPYELHDNVASA
jgi:hypothetical protein